MEENKELMQETEAAEETTPVEEATALIDTPTEEALVQEEAPAWEPIAEEAPAAEAPKRKKLWIAIVAAVVALVAILVAVFAGGNSVASNRKKLCKYIEQNGALMMQYENDTVKIDADGDTLIFRGETGSSTAGLNYTMEFEMRVKPEEDVVEFSGSRLLNLRLTPQNYGTFNNYGHGELTISEAKPNVKLYFAEYVQDEDSSHGGKKSVTTSGEAEDIAVDGRYWAVLLCMDDLLEEAGLTPADIGFTALEVSAE